MDSFSETIKFVDEFCSKNNLNYSIIGGIALINYHNFRATQDIDVTIDLEIEDLENIYGIITKSFSPILPNPKEFFLKNFILPVYLERTKVKVDIAPGLTGFEKRAIERSKKVNLGEISANVCTLEDLIIFKLIAGRPQDLLDVDKLFNVNKKIDMNYLTKTAKEFIEIDKPEVYERLQSFLKKY